MAGFKDFREIAAWQTRAKGSEAEVLNHLIDARDLCLLSDEEFLRAEHLTKRALKAGEWFDSIPRIHPRSAATTLQTQTAERTIARGTGHPAPTLRHP